MNVVFPDHTHILFDRTDIRLVDFHCTGVYKGQSTRQFCISNLDKSIFIAAYVVRVLIIFSNNVQFHLLYPLFKAA